MRLKPEFSRYTTFLLDLDGVLWRGKYVISDAIEAVKTLISIGKNVIFLTNNSTKDRKEYALRLSSLGINISIKHIITSAFATASFMKNYLRLRDAYVIGELGLKRELENQGIKVFSEEECATMSFVSSIVVGLDRELTYRKLAIALKALLKGATFIATNEDSTLPTEEGLVPGAGSIVAAISYALGRRPEYVVGKPNKWIFEIALKEFSIHPSEAIVVGDRLDTDIRGAVNMGIDSILVLTGVARLSDIENSRIKPSYVLKSLKELFR